MRLHKGIDGSRVLISPFGMMYEEITASSIEWPALKRMLDRRDPIYKT